MRKILFMFMMFSSILLLTSCNKVNFNGSRTGNESEFIMKYSILNGTDSQALELKEGDFIDAEIVIDSCSANGGLPPMVIRQQYYNSLKEAA